MQSRDKLYIVVLTTGGISVSVSEAHVTYRETKLPEDVVTLRHVQWINTSICFPLSEIEMTAVCVKLLFCKIVEQLQ